MASSVVNNIIQKTTDIKATTVIDAYGLRYIATDVEKSRVKTAPIL